MSYLAKILFDPLVKAGETLFAISPFILFIGFSSLAIWIYKTLKKQNKEALEAFEKQVAFLNESGVKRSEQISTGLNNVQTAFDAAIKQMNKEIKKFESLMIEYKIINKKILVDEFDTIKQMIKEQASIMVNTVKIAVCEHRRVEVPDPFDIADIIADDLHKSSATRRNELRSAKITAKVVDIYEEAEVDIHNTLDGYILKFAKKANDTLDKTNDCELIEALAENTTNQIVNHFIKALQLRLSIKEK